ncbi:MAG: tetratricopeptide repeat protein [Blastocatellia bacterium]
MTDRISTDRLSVFCWLALFIWGVALTLVSTVHAQDKPARPRPKIELSEDDDAPVKKAAPLPVKTAPEPVAPSKRKAARKPVSAAKNAAAPAEKSSPARTATAPQAKTEVQSEARPNEAAPGVMQSALDAALKAPAEKTEPTKPERATVFFLSDVPAVEVFLNGEKVGVTNKDKRLALALSPGHYVITTAQNGVAAARPLIISIVGNRTDVTFSMGTVVASPPATTPRPAPPKAEPSAKPNATARKIVINKYLEQKTADNLMIEDWKTVLAQSQQVLAATPEDAEALLHVMIARGQIAHLTGKYEDALLLFRNAQHLSSSPLVSLGLANTYLAMQQPAQAVTALEPLMQAETPLPWAYKLLGAAYEQQKDYKKAMQAYRDAAQRGYDGNLITLALHQSQARQWMKEKQWKQALTMLLNDVNQAPSAALWLDIGECYERLKFLYNAAQAYTKAVTLEKSSALGWFRLGTALFDLKDYHGAKTAFDEAVRLDPSGRAIDVNYARKQALEAGRKF